MEKSIKLNIIHIKYTILINFLLTFHKGSSILLHGFNE